jgi:hypothetical protein
MLGAMTKRATGGDTAMPIRPTPSEFTHCVQQGQSDSEVGQSTI